MKNLVNLGTKTWIFTSGKMLRWKINFISGREVNAVFDVENENKLGGKIAWKLDEMLQYTGEAIIGKTFLHDGSKDWRICCVSQKNVQCCWLLEFSQFLQWAFRPHSNIENCRILLKEIKKFQIIWNNKKYWNTQKIWKNVN